MGIFNRWRQLSRRYFWSHFMLGVVAASFGVPSSLASAVELTQASVASRDVNFFNYSVSSIGSEVRRQNLPGNAQAFDPQQNGFNQFLSRQALMVVPASHYFYEQPFVEQPLFTKLQNDEQSSLDYWQQADRLAELRPADLNLSPLFIASVIESTPFLKHQTGLWLVSVGGLRAGPHSAYFLI